MPTSEYRSGHGTRPVRQPSSGVPSTTVAVAIGMSRLVHNRWHFETLLRGPIGRFKSGRDLKHARALTQRSGGVPRQFANSRSQAVPVRGISRGNSATTAKRHVRSPLTIVARVVSVVLIGFQLPTITQTAVLFYRAAMPEFKGSFWSLRRSVVRAIGVATDDVHGRPAAADLHGGKAVIVGAWAIHGMLAVSA